MNSKWADYKEGRKIMGCSCGGTKVATNIPASLLSSSGNFDPEALVELSGTNSPQGQIVELGYVGPIQETFSLRSRSDPNVTYRFGNNEYNRIKPVFLPDAEHYMGMVDQFARPLYRIVTAGASLEVHDPTAFLGQRLESA